jgi:hypothetical protein
MYVRWIDCWFIEQHLLICTGYIAPKGKMTVIDKLKMNSDVVVVNFKLLSLYL